MVKKPDKYKEGHDQIDKTQNIFSNEGLIVKSRKKIFLPSGAPFIKDKKNVSSRIILPGDRDYTIEKTFGYHGRRGIREMREAFGLRIEEFFKFYPNSYKLDCGGGKGVFIKQMAEYLGPEASKNLYYVTREVQLSLDTIIANCLNKEKIKEFYSKVNLPNKETLDQFHDYLSICLSHATYAPQYRKHEREINRDHNALYEFLKDKNVPLSIKKTIEQKLIKTAYRIGHNVDLSSSATREFINFCSANPQAIDDFINPILKNQQLDISNEEQKKNIYGVYTERQKKADMIDYVHDLPIPDSNNPDNGIGIMTHSRSDAYMSSEEWIYYMSIASERFIYPHKGKKAGGIYFSDRARGVFGDTKESEKNIAALGHSAFLLLRRNPNLGFCLIKGPRDTSDFHLYKDQPKKIPDLYKAIYKILIAYSVAPVDMKLSDQERSNRINKTNQVIKSKFLDFSQIPGHPNPQKCSLEQIIPQRPPKKYYLSCDFTMTSPNLPRIEEGIRELRLIIWEIEKKLADLIDNKNKQGNENQELLDYLEQVEKKEKVDGKYLAEPELYKLLQKSNLILPKEQEALKKAQILKAQGLWKEFLDTKKYFPDKNKLTFPFNDIPKEIDKKDRKYSKLTWSMSNPLFKYYEHQNKQAGDTLEGPQLREDLTEAEKAELMQFLSGPAFTNWRHSEELLHCNIFEETDNKIIVINKQAGDRNKALNTPQNKQAIEDVKYKCRQNLLEVKEKLNKPPVLWMPFGELDAIENIIPIDKTLQNILGGQKSYDELTKKLPWNLNKFSEQKYNEKIKELSPYLKDGGLLILSGLAIDYEKGDTMDCFSGKLFPLIFDAVEKGVPLHVLCEGFAYQMLCKFYAERHNFACNLRKGHGKVASLPVKFKEFCYDPNDNKKYAKATQEIFKLLNLSSENDIRSFNHLQFLNATFEDNDYLKPFANDYMSDPLSELDGLDGLDENTISAIKDINSSNAIGQVSGVINNNGNIIGVPFLASKWNQVVDSDGKLKKSFTADHTVHYLQRNRNSLSINHFNRHIFPENSHGNSFTANPDEALYTAFFNYCAKEVLKNK